MRQKVTVFLKMPFKEFDCEALVYSGVASVTLVAAPVRGPLVLVGLPWELTLVDEPLFVLFGIVPGSPDWFLMYVITKASEASWSYSCDSKVSFDWVQILTPDFSGRRPPPTHPPTPLPTPHSPPPLSPPPLSSSLSSSHLPSVPPSSLFASSTPSCRRSLACG